MTPEERAAQIVAANDFLLELRDDDRVGLASVIASAIREAEDAERERAAEKSAALDALYTAVMRYDDNPDGTLERAAYDAAKDLARKTIAAAIRARQ